MIRQFVLTCAAAVVWLASHAETSAACRKVLLADDVQISEAALKDLKALSIDRDEIMKALIDTSVPETNGCWAGSAGNFDRETISAGAAQWNLGQGTLQVLLASYKKKFGDGLTSKLAELMPKYGTLVFSKGCLQDPIQRECKEKLLALQSGGKLTPDFKAELDALFESDVMIQVQMDQFVKLVTKVKSDLQRIFPDRAVTPRQIKWAIDTKIQQGTFPADDDIKRVRERFANLTSTQRTEKLSGQFDWYEGLARSGDQDGVRVDWEWNMPRWQQCLKNGVSDEQADLLILSFIRSRVAEKASGLYQALTFQRRARIILGVGSVAGHKLGGCQQTAQLN